MLTFLKNLSQTPNYHISSNNPQNTDRCDQSMIRQHICPCCSYTLLRHIDLDGVYWHCSHCYQRIPVYN